ncbi:hypothetical protein H5410_054505 [Solanum commersonii]|nr:hypothetical protein H5410_054505 [Solanum commersonii]
MCVFFFFFFSVGSFCCPVFCFNGLVFLFVFMYMPNSANMGDKFGQVKVMVVQGRRLVIRDFKSSDPYVILKLGNQTAKTKVINSCLNPVWNEEFHFSISEHAQVLKLQVFDKDHFKADDKMGNAHLSLQPLVASARLRKILGVTAEGTTLRKVIPESDNCLAADSSINWVNGEVVQDVWLRLCDVDSGDIELKIKLINLPSAAPSK